jgi:probable HAF family extracellular repeat protein
MWNGFSGSSIHGFVYRDGTVTDLGTFGGSGATVANAISWAGVVVGYSNAPSGNRAFRWEDGVLSDLNLPLGPHSNANDVNDARQIVGWMGPDIGAKAFRWDNGVITQLDFSPLTSAAYSINNHGDCVGFIHTQTPNGAFNKAVMWKADGEVVYLGILPGYSHARAWDINDDGTIIGWCFNSPPGPGQPGFIWCDGILTDLNEVAPATFDGRPFGININGQVATQGYINGDVGAVLTPIPGFPGDYDCDKVVDMDDLLAVINHWGPSGGASAADFDQNKAVDMDDVLAVINNWGPVGSARER